MIGAKPDKPRALRLTAQYADYWNVFHLQPARADCPDAGSGRCGLHKGPPKPATLQRTSTVLFDVPVAPKGAALADWRNYRTVAGPIPAVHRKWPTLCVPSPALAWGMCELWLDPYSVAGHRGLRAGS